MSKFANVHFCVFFQWIQGNCFNVDVSFTLKKKKKTFHVGCLQKKTRKAKIKSKEMTTLKEVEGNSRKEKGEKDDTQVHML